jgi:hypothetical protein
LHFVLRTSNTRETLRVGPTAGEWRCSGAGVPVAERRWYVQRLYGVGAFIPFLGASVLRIFVASRVATPWPAGSRRYMVAAAGARSCTPHPALPTSPARHARPGLPPDFPTRSRSRRS